MAVDVLVFRDPGDPASSSFEVAPRVGDLVQWHDPALHADSMMEVTAAWHNPGATGFSYSIRLTSTTNSGARG